MPQTWVQATITSVVQETESTRRFLIEVQGTDDFQFEPGQFVTLDLPIHEQKNKRWRSYSIASPPNGTNTFELVIVKLEGGAGTAWLWENGNAGAGLTMMGPLGKFTLPEIIDTNLYFICTGTGIAPFRSMVHHIHRHNIPHQNIYLVFGCRHLKDALYMNELKQLQEEMNNFYYLPTFSREPADNALQLRTGYVHSVYEELIVTAASQAGDANNVCLQPSSFYLCGWKDMIDQAREKIQLLGYDKKSIHLELYG